MLKQILSSSTIKELCMKNNVEKIMLMLGFKGLNKTSREFATLIRSSYLIYRFLAALRSFSWYFKASS